MNHTTGPDFFIVGAAKAGTTSIADYLSQHPQIYMSPVKEPHYFAKDINPEDLRPLLKKRLKHVDLEMVFQTHGKVKLHRAYITDRETYQKLFEFRGNEKVAGEASPSYLYSTVAAQEIYNYNPAAKIIIVLREPVSRAFSHYLMDLRIGYTKGTFEEALEEDTRTAGLSWGSRSHYRELGLYADQVKRYLNIFPKQQILVLLYDELQADTPATVHKILRFLEVHDDISNINLSAKNPAMISRINVDLQLPVAEKLKQKVIALLGDSALKQKLKNIIYKKPEHAHPLPATTRMLKQYFREDIIRLEELTGISLQAWKKIQ